MDTVSQLQSMGLSLPSPAYIFGAILFSLLGVALMFYPYVVTNTVMLYVVGIALCAAAAWDDRQDA